MASTTSPLLKPLPLQRTPKSSPAPPPPRVSTLPTRRQLLFVLSSAAALAIEGKRQPSKAQDIPLFGLRKNLRKAEEETEEIVKEGFEAADKGIEAAEKGIEAAERGIGAAEREIETAVSFGRLAQAGAVAGAEVVAVVVASSVVNGILGAEEQRSS